MDKPKIKIESDGDFAIIHLNGKHIKSSLIDFNFHADAKDGIHIRWHGIMNKLDKNGRVYVENDKIATEEFYYDSMEGTNNEI